MNGETATVASRPRPLSAGGLRSLLWWLRRNERPPQRSSSDESVSSVGSDRTAISFAFLSPTSYRSGKPAICAVPPPGPPTDSYRRRIHDRDLRRQLDREITLHRKYRLPAAADGVHYDAFSLPPVRRANSHSVDRQERARRAASECDRRRAAHVPGKRRAPQPPAAIPHRVSSAATLPHRASRKRRAPPPPNPCSVGQLLTIEEHTTSSGVNMNPKTISSKSSPEKRPYQQINYSTNQQKEDGHHVRNIKTKSEISERSFFKNYKIFESKKRASISESPPIRVLPNISELDRQASEIYESCKLRTSADNNFKVSITSKDGHPWFCTKCLKKYTPDVIACPVCYPKENKNTSKLKNQSIDILPSAIRDGTENAKSTLPCTTCKNEEDKLSLVVNSNHNRGKEEKQKLKEILKEMKHSLPKHTKSEKNQLKNKPSDEGETISNSGDSPGGGRDAPTLRIGCSPKSQEPLKIADDKMNSRNFAHIEEKKMETPVITQTIVISYSAEIKTGIEEKTREPQNNLILNSSAKGETKQLLDKNNICPNQSKIVSDILCAATPMNVNQPSNNYNTAVTTEKISLQDVKLDNVKTTSNNKYEHSGILKLLNTTNFSLDKLEPPQLQNNTPFNSNINDIANSSTTANQSDKLLAGIPELREEKNVASDKALKSEPFSSSPTALVFKKNLNRNDTKSVVAQEKATDIVVGEIPANKATSNNQTNFKFGQDARSSSTSPLNQEMRNSSPPQLLNLDRLQNSSSIPPAIMKTKYSQQSVPKPRLLDPKKLQTSLSTSPLLKSERPKSSLITPSTLNMERPQGLLPISSPLVADNKRRDLVNQLERSIAQGDEHAAAEAAMGLAKLRVSCAVLSAPAVLNTVSPAISQPLTITGLINSLTDNAPIPSLSTKLPSMIKPNELIADSSKLTVSEPPMQTVNKSAEGQKKPVIVFDKPIKKTNVSTQLSLMTNVTNVPATHSVTTSAPQPSVKTHLPCSSSNTPGQDEMQVVDVIVEDRELQRGPVPVRVPRNATLGELRHSAEQTLGIPARLQRWIIGTTLCNDEVTPIRVLAGPAFNAPFYLCLVESEINKEEKADCGDSSSKGSSTSKSNNKKSQEKEVYKELVELERCALVPTGEDMECGVCLERCERGAGAVLRECLHAFCRECLAAAIRHCAEPTVACLAMGCGAQLQEREVRALVSAEDYERWLARGLAAAESGSKHAFHCRTTDCTGWALCEPGVLRFECPVCGRVNCVPCQSIHEGETCGQRRSRVLESATAQTTSRDADEGTQALLDSLVARGEALECPECNALITKKWGCDWVRCSACKTEICWVTRGRRWGPGGRGDTSAGCRCGVDGRRCHPSCSYCH